MRRRASVVVGAMGMVGMVLAVLASCGHPHPPPVAAAPPGPIDIDAEWPLGPPVEPAAPPGRCPETDEWRGDDRLQVALPELVEQGARSICIGARFDGALIGTLYYRPLGAPEFTAVRFEPGDGAAFARIPAEATHCGLVQIYITVTDQADTLIARAGRATSPEIIEIGRYAHHVDDDMR